MLQYYLVKYRYQIILISILLFALFLRTIHLTTNPIALNQDEAVNGYDAFTLGKTLADHHGNFLPPFLQSFNDWASPLLTYLTVPFVMLFGLSVKTIRLVVVILGVTSIGLFYVFLKQLAFKEIYALLGAFLLAIMPWHIVYSRIAIPPSIVCFSILLFLVLFLWGYQRAEEKIRPWLFILPGLAAAALTYSYPTQKLFVPIFILILCAIYLKKQIVNALTLLVVYGLGVLPIYLLTYLNPGKYNASFNALSIMGAQNPLREFLVRYGEYFLPYFHFQVGDIDIIHHVPGFGISYDFLSLFFYLGIVICIMGAVGKIEIKNITRNTYLLLIAWTVLFPVAASLTAAYNMAFRVVHGLPLVIIFFLITFQFVEQHLKPRFANFLLGVILVLGLMYTWGFMKLYLYEYPKISYKEFQYGIEDYMQYLLSHEKDFDKVVVDTSINQPYIYFLFYSQLEPSKLNRADPMKSTNKYVFSVLPTFNEDEKNIIKEVSFGDTRLYRIYANGRSWYVKKM